MRVRGGDKAVVLGIEGEEVGLRTSAVECDGARSYLEEDMACPDFRLPFFAGALFVYLDEVQAKASSDGPDDISGVSGKCRFFKRLYHCTLAEPAEVPAIGACRCFGIFAG